MTFIHPPPGHRFTTPGKRPPAAKFNSRVLLTVPKGLTLTGTAGLAQFLYQPGSVGDI